MKKIEQLLKDNTCNMFSQGWYKKTAGNIANELDMNGGVDAESIDYDKYRSIYLWQMKAIAPDRLFMIDKIINKKFLDDPDFFPELEKYCKDHGRILKRGNIEIDNSYHSWIIVCSLQ